MQTWRTLEPLLRVGQQDFKPTRLPRNLLPLTPVRKLHRPHATLLNDAESEGSIEFPNHRVKFYHSEASLDKVPGKLATVMRKRKLDSLASRSYTSRDGISAKKRESAPNYQKDGNESQQPGFANITAPKGEGLQETDGTRAQKMLSGFLLNSYLFCLIIVPYLFLQ